MRDCGVLHGSHVKSQLTPPSKKENAGKTELPFALSVVFVSCSALERVLRVRHPRTSLLHRMHDQRGRCRLGEPVSGSTVKVGRWRGQALPERGRQCTLVQVSRKSQKGRYSPSAT